MSHQASSYHVCRAIALPSFLFSPGLVADLQKGMVVLRRRFVVAVAVVVVLSFLFPPVAQASSIIKGPSARAQGPARPLRSIWGILLHSTQGLPRGDLSVLSRSSNVSVHYLIMPKGKVYQLVSLRRTAFHAGRGYLAGHRGSINRGLIGIEMSNRSVPGRRVPYPESQLAALDSVLRTIDRVTHRRLPIYGHKEVLRDGGWRKSDPDGAFPLRMYKRYRKHITPPSVLRVGPYTKQRNLNGFWTRMVASQGRARVRRFDESQRHVRRDGRKYTLVIGPLAPKRAVRESRRAARVVPRSKVKVAVAPSRLIVAHARVRVGRKVKARRSIGAKKPERLTHKIALGLTHKIVLGYIPPKKKPETKPKTDDALIASLTMSKAVAEEPSLPKRSKPAVRPQKRQRHKAASSSTRRRRPVRRSYLQIGPYKKSKLGRIWRRMVARQERAKVREFKSEQRHVVRLYRRGAALRIGPLRPRHAAHEAKRARQILPEKQVQVVRVKQ